MASVFAPRAMVKLPAIGQRSIRTDKVRDVAGLIREIRRCGIAEGCGTAASMAVRGSIASHPQSGPKTGRTSAADLKSLHRLLQTRARDFKSISGTRII